MRGAGRLLNVIARLQKKRLGAFLTPRIWLNSFRASFMFSISVAIPTNIAISDTFYIREITYREIEEFTPRAIDFENFSNRNIDSTLVVGDASFGERFFGQNLGIKQDMFLRKHDILVESDIESPLKLKPGPLNQNFEVRFDETLGSQALMPLGPPEDAALSYDTGTGSIAILFSQPMCYLALKISVDGISYDNSTWSKNTVRRRFDEGIFNIIFYNSDGVQLANFKRYFDSGTLAIGYMQTSISEAQIAGVFIQNLDPYGIGIDDIRFDPICPFRLF